MDSRLSNPDLLPTKQSDRTWSRWHIAALWVGMAICIPTYTLASGMMEQGWSIEAALAAIILGNFIVLVPMILNAHAGTKYGIPFPVLLRASFGVFGANIPAMMRAVVACGWFGIQTWIGGSAIYSLLQSLGIQIGSTKLPALGITSGELFCFLLFWAIQVAIIWRGIHSIRILETLAAPFLILMGILLFTWAWTSTLSFSEVFFLKTDHTKTFASALLGAGLTSGVAFWGTLALNIPDFARYARSQKDQVSGQIIGLVPTMAGFAFIGAFVTNATVIVLGVRVGDPIQLITQIGGPFTSAIALIGVTLATLTTNLAANVVSPANDFSNLSPNHITFRQGALIASVLGILIMPWKLYNDAANFLFTWLIGYGGMLGAVAGVMIVDYYFIRKCKLNVDHLYKRYGEYGYHRGINTIAVSSLALGIFVNIPGFLGALDIIETSSFFQAIYERAWFVAFFLSGATYYAGMSIKEPVHARQEPT